MTRANKRLRATKIVPSEESINRIFRALMEAKLKTLIILIGQFSRADYEVYLGLSGHFTVRKGRQRNRYCHDLAELQALARELGVVDHG